MKWPVSKATIKVLYALHSWTGVIVGITLFVICFSGAIVVFKHEIDLWANPQINIPWPEGSAENNYNIDPLVGPQQALDTFREAYPEKPFLFMRLPHPETSATYAVLLPGRHYIYLNAINGQLLNATYHEYAQFLRTLHVRLFMGAEGRWLVGVFGLAMLVSIITGVLIHKHIFRDFFKLRLKRSFRLALSDIHKAGGVWALLFHIIIAITGAWIGLIGLINPAAEFFTTPEKQITAPAPKPASMQSLDVLLQRTQQIIPSLQPRAIYFDNYGFSGAQITVAGDLPGWVVESGAAQATFNGNSGALLEVQNFQNTQATTRLFYLMEPLHFGDFGGYGLIGLLL
ncbi:MAG TPA: PepSY-associated TM helix domain-containing protein, partial [Gammaproteobacteria bacterium]|nr:PepSY-associated TM helix domain-containing protein [Gammaproteobacteria bacterium]